MNQMNVAGMNPGVGGPVGGVPMMNNGSTAPRNDGNMNNPEMMINNLNTYIYDYFLKRGYHDCARALVQDESIKLNTDPGNKTSPGNRRDGDVNGIDGDPMMTDGKDGEKIKIPDDLPRPSLPNDSPQSSFLLDWFSLFWDFFWAQRKRGNSQEVRQYLQHTQNMMRIREQQQNQILRQQQPLMPGQMNPLNMRRPNGMVPPNLQKTVLQNNTSGLSQQQLAAQFTKNQQMQMMQQMQRDQSEIDMNGNRPQSPASADNAPSPSKRQRLEGGAVNGTQLAPNGRPQGQGMQGQPTPQALMMQNGMAQRGMTPAQLQQLQQGQQQKSMQVYAQDLTLHHTRSALNSQGIPNGGMMNPGVMPNQADLVPMPDGQGMYPMGPEYYSSNGQMAQVRPGMQTPGGLPGNHALQDYQMQLMLLEQQNKRRLMMARQEQDSMARADGQPPMPGQGLPPGTSPQGSRTGASPNPSEQMKRGTPKMPQTGLPGSPSAADLAQNRGSPGSMNLNGAQMPDMGASFFPGGPSMRPPSSNPSFTGPQMGQPLAANAAARVPSGQWPQPGQPMPPQHSPATQVQAGTPQERGAMLPPPPAAGASAGRGQPPSPQTGNAPPTPQQKPNQRKKDGKDTRKRPTKKAAAAANAAAGATPSTEAADPPPTPTPSTPVTPHPPPNSFPKGGANATASAPPPPTAAPAPQPMHQSQQPFSDFGTADNLEINLDFGNLDNPDILESFDFDTFLNPDGDGTGFGFDPSMPFSTDGVETGAGDGL
ncbi:uncharacterized protein N7459_006148 [Penicillium hispanicum]|uniref:uncharacterized protein n=1 Tax=Penicillium hispanicum TaxID=1080232 RepID=UPI0025414596|nr:uncharacterized protein N7459_006148 [Penicillium hispanicum]KAJ5580163.1 hypothetical protein N7459_006148 [Penicillium hispanicum]